jgi:predicted nucleotide-binding protein
LSPATDTKRIEYEILRLVRDCSDDLGLPGDVTSLSAVIPGMRNGPKSHRKLVGALKRLNPKHLTIWKYSTALRKRLQYPAEIKDDIQVFNRQGTYLCPTEYTDPYIEELAAQLSKTEQQEAVRMMEKQQESPGVAAATPAREVLQPSRKVFVVHGHDEGAREKIARFLERAGFEPIILHEQASRGRTVIEKVEAHSNVDFAVVLLTPDDEGCEKGGTPRPRARQNVVLELGYFVGLLGRNRVCALKRGDLEIPSDFTGVVYVPFDDSDGWKQALGKELEAAGFKIDWDKTMGAH